MTITDRDELGRIKKGGKKITSQEAREIGLRGKKVYKEASSLGLLEEAGYDGDAPEHLVILAQIAAGNKASAVAAMNAFLKLTKKTDSGELVENGGCPFRNECVIFRTEGE